MLGPMIKKNVFIQLANRMPSGVTHAARRSSTDMNHGQIQPAQQNNGILLISCAAYSLNSKQRPVPLSCSPLRVVLLYTSTITASHSW